jgi:Recombination endonuclease VII
MTWTSNLIRSRNVTSTCIICHMSFDYIYRGTGWYREFCSAKCRWQWNHRRQREMELSNPDFYYKTKIRRSLWYKDYKRKNKERLSKLNRENKFQVRYGISIEEHYNMFCVQKGKCASCSIPFENVNKAFVDHDHKTGKVRGLLCSSCNFALGSLQDDPKIIRGLLYYIEGFINEQTST